MRTPSTTTYRRGDVVLLPFPYTDQSSVKRRPAVIRSITDYNVRRADVIVAPITSNLATGQSDDIALNDWSTAGLLKPSAVKGILGTVKKSLIIRTMGTLSTSDLQIIEKKFADILGLSALSP